MLRLFVVMLTAAACVAFGANAGLAGFGLALDWPLSEANFRQAAQLGAGWGVGGASVAALCLLITPRKHLWVAALVAVVVTWLMAFAALWWYVVSNLG